MKKVVRVLQGSVGTQTVLGGLTVYTQVTKFLWCIYVENYDNWLRVCLFNSSQRVTLNNASD